MIDPGSLVALMAAAATSPHAVLDVRERGPYEKGHIFRATSLPRRQLETRLPGLVTAPTTPIVLVDEDGSLAELARPTLADMGYRDVRVLRGGVRGWRAEGRRLVQGFNVPSKVFGERMLHEMNTPEVSCEELDRRMKAGADFVLVDSRTPEEYHRACIPGAVSMPGAELVLRIRDLAPSPQTIVVVNCAGRTRSIIGAQSLINAGVPNKVVALRNGTMGWTLAGLACESGKARRAPTVSPAGLAWAKSAAAGVAARFGITRIDRATLERWRADGGRTLYLLDVRDSGEYAAGHVAGALSAPGGQLVQATDQYVGTLGARIVLVDDAEVRAVMTASWLRQMGWADVFVLAEAGGETGWPAPAVLGPAPDPALCIDVGGLAALLARDAATVVDLSLSRDYLKAHIPDAWFAIRSRLARAFAAVPLRGTLVLTSEDGVLAGLAAGEAQALVDTPVRVLEGGNAAWLAAGHALTADDPRMADDAVDTWLKPYERAKDTTQAMQDYLSWEVDLLARIERDGTARFAQARS